MSKGTIERAYDLLEQDGVIETRGRAGTFVRSRGASHAGDPVGEADLHDAADALAVIARQVGATDEATVAAVRAALDQLR